MRKDALSTGMCLVFFLIQMSLANCIYDLDVFVNATDNFTVGEANPYKVIITNNETASDTIYLELERRIYSGENVIYEHTGDYELKKSLTKSYQWTPDESGGFRICATITNISIMDSNESNNMHCRDIHVILAGNERTNNTDAGEESDDGSGNRSDEEDNSTGDVVPDNSSVCDLALSIETEKEIYDSGDGLGIKVHVNDLNYIYGSNGFMLSYRIEDLFGNVIRSYSNNYTVEEHERRDYDPKAPEIYGSEAYIVIAELSNSSCNDTNVQNDYAEKMIIVKGLSAADDGNAGSGSYISIEKATPEKVNFGGVIYAEIEVYRGDTSKYSLSLRVERPDDGFDVSEKTTIYLNDKNTKYKLRVPIQLKPNCNGRYKDGEYVIVIEGLNVTEKKSTYISGISSTYCKTETKTVKKYIYVSKNDQTESYTSTNISKTNVENKEKEKDFDVVFTGFNDSINIGESFTTFLDVINRRNETLSISLYGYVIDGKSRLSEGLSDDGWMKSWTGNTKEIIIGSGEIKNLNLTNRIMKNITGEFLYKIKVKGDLDRVYEREINISNSSDSLNEEGMDDYSKHNGVPGNNILFPDDSYVSYGTEGNNSQINSGKKTEYTAYDKDAKISGMTINAEQNKESFLVAFIMKIISFFGF